MCNTEAFRCGAPHGFAWGRLSPQPPVIVPVRGPAPLSGRLVGSLAQDLREQLCRNLYGPVPRRAGLGKTLTQKKVRKRKMASDGRMTITEAARRVGVSPKTIRRWETSDKVPFARKDWRNECSPRPLSVKTRGPDERMGQRMVARLRRQKEIEDCNGEERR